jgi:hypothetical protein
MADKWRLGFEQFPPNARAASASTLQLTSVVSGQVEGGNEGKHPQATLCLNARLTQAAMKSAKAVVLKRQGEIKKWQGRILSYYRWRNRLLLVGFMAFVVSKLVIPYLA